MKDLNKALEKNNKRGRICFAMADAFGGAGAFLAKGAVIGIGIGLLFAIGADLYYRKSTKIKHEIRLTTK